MVTAQRLSARTYRLHEQFYRGRITLETYQRRLSRISALESRLWQRQHPISVIKLIVGLFLPLLFAGDPLGIRRAQPHHS